MGPHTIQPLSALPFITNPAIIDGTTEPDYVGTPVIELDGTSAGIAASGLVITAGSSTVRGLAINRFVIGFGIILDGGGNVVQSNFLGTDVTGTLDLGNDRDGVFIVNSADNTIGGTLVGEGNVISGNNRYSVLIANPPSTGNMVQGNLIGTQVDGSSPLGNTLDGVRIAGASSNTNGGEAAGTGNTIAYNGGDGVFVESGTDNAIVANSIHSNAGLGIDLEPNGVTPNDPDDVDTGPNNLQNFPVLTAATTGSTTIEGTLNSTASTTFRLEFFSNAACDASGNGEGESFIGFSDETTDGTGNASFSVTFLDTVPVGQFITATATDPATTRPSFPGAPS